MTVKPVKPDEQQARLSLTKVPHFNFFWTSQTNNPSLTDICLNPTEVKLLTANN